MATVTTSGIVVRSVRKLASGDVEVVGIPADLHPLVVVVPFARSSETDIVRALELAQASRRPKKAVTS